MFAEQFKNALLGERSLARIDHLARDLWKAHGAGAISDSEAQHLAEMLHDGRGKAREARQSVGIPVGRISIFRPRRYQASPDRAASIRRRRKIASSGPLPPALAALFTVSELAVLGIVADEVRLNGLCALSVGELAARAGVCRSTCQNALRLAAGEGMIAVQERRRQGKVNLTNVVRIVSAEWLSWIARARRPARVGFKFSDPTDTAGSNPVKTEDVSQRFGSFGEVKRRDWASGGNGRSAWKGQR
jgi:hypothetical protein